MFLELVPGRLRAGIRGRFGIGMRWERYGQGCSMYLVHSTGLCKMVLRLLTGPLVPFKALIPGRRHAAKFRVKRSAGQRKALGSAHRKLTAVSSYLSCTLQAPESRSSRRVWRARSLKILRGCALFPRFGLLSFANDQLDECLARVWTAESLLLEDRGKAGTACQITGSEP